MKRAGYWEKGSIYCVGGGESVVGKNKFGGFNIEIAQMYGVGVGIPPKVWGISIWS